MAKMFVRNGAVPLRGSGAVFFGEEGDSRPCKCCATACAGELSIAVSFCGMTVNESIPIPGVLFFPAGFQALPDGSYLILSAEISCTPCGWAVSLGVCAFCVATDQAASDAFTALVPFAAAPEQPPNFYCPEAGPVNLVCFGDQFGIPCVTAAGAVIG
jgi:hypothetical protein